MRGACLSGHEALTTKADLAASKAELRGEIDGLRTEMKVGFANLRVEMHELAHGVKSEIVRWLFLVILGQTAVLAGAGYFYINTLMH